jgi:hypothetical protein
MVAQIEWPAGWTVNRIAETTFFEIGRAAGELYAVASHHAVFRRGQDEVWRAVYIPEHPDELTSLATFGGEAYAGGRSAPGGGIVRLRGNTWAPIGLDDRYHVFDVTPLGGNTLLAAGMVKNTVSGRILVGRY